MCYNGTTCQFCIPCVQLSSEWFDMILLMEHNILHHLCCKKTGDQLCEEKTPKYLPSLSVSAGFLIAVPEISSNTSICTWSFPEFQYLSSGQNPSYVGKGSKEWHMSTNGTNGWLSISWWSKYPRFERDERGYLNWNQQASMGWILCL